MMFRLSLLCWKDWGMKTCLKCTFQNSGRRRRCEMCNSVLDDASPVDAIAETTKTKRARSASVSQARSSQEHHDTTVTHEAPRDDFPPMFSTGNGSAVKVTSRKGLALMEEAEKLSKEPKQDKLPRAESNKPKKRQRSLSSSQARSAQDFSELSLSASSLRDIDLPETSKSARIPPTESANKRPPPPTTAVNDTNAPPPMMMMFSTARGGAIKVSAEALAKAAKLLAQDDNDAPVDAQQEVASESRPTVRTSTTANGGFASAQVPSIAVDRRGQNITTTRALLGNPIPERGELSNANRPAFRSPSSVNSNVTQTAAVEQRRPGFQTPLAGSGSKRFTAPRLHHDTSDQSYNAKIVPRNIDVPPPRAVVALKGQSTLKPIQLTDDLRGGEFRCPLRRDLPTIDQALGDAYLFPWTLCCPVLQALASTESLQETCQRLESHHLINILVALGGRRDALTRDWIASALRVVMFKLLVFEHSSASLPNVTTFSPMHVVMQLIYRYNREYVEGHRSVLRRIVEKDTPSTTLMILRVVSTVLPERPGPHQLTIEVSDGWYIARVNLDLPLTQLVQDRLIVVGDKIAVWGATACHESARSPLEFLHSKEAVLHLSFNGVKRASDDAKLGAQPPNTIMSLPISCIHPNGGTVPCITGIVTRVLPRFFTERIADNANNGGGGDKGSSNSKFNKIVRNAIAEARAAQASELSREVAYERAINQGLDCDAAAMQMRDKFTRNVSEVTTIMLETGKGEVVAVQRTSANGRGGGCDYDEGALPKEGQRVHMFNLIPSKSSNAPPPLNVKLLFVRGPLLFVVDKVHPDPSELSTRSFRFLANVDTSLTALAARVFGQMVDVIVICVGSKSTADGNSSLCFCGIERNVFALLSSHSNRGMREIPLPTPTPGTACIIQHATFACYDESGEYNLIRMHANEYTTVSTRSMSLSLQQQMKQLESPQQKLLWKSTFDLGVALLVDQVDRFGSVASSNGRVSAARGGEFEVAAYAVLPEVDPVSDFKPHASGEVRAPYYLKEKQTTIFSTPNTGTGVKLLSSGGAALSTARSLFVATAGQEPHHQSSGNSGQRHHHEASSSDNTNTSPPAAAISSLHHHDRHVFGNFSTANAAAAIVVGTFVDEHPLDSSMHCSYLTSSQEPHTRITAVESSARLPDVSLCFAFASHVGALRVRLPPTMMAALAGMISLTPQQLSALASNEESSHLAENRSILLSHAEDPWHDLWLRSVVLPPHVEIAMQAIVVGGSTTGGTSPTLTTSVLADVDASGKIQRWNRNWVASGSEVLWWTAQEWQQLLQELEESLHGKLFKLTLSDTEVDVVERLYYLKDFCPIADLLE